jgi:hypothetical protein
MRRLLPAIGLVLLVTRIRPPLEFARHSVLVEADPQEVVRQLRERLSSGGGVLCEQEDSIVARFAGYAGRFKWHTVEFVRFGPGRVDCEHLGGTFRGTSQRFTLAPLADSTEVVHTGSLRMPDGLFGWAAGILFARRSFEQHVAQHMEAMQSRSESRHHV